MKDLLPFEKKVLAGLEKCCFSSDSFTENSPLGIAVSGGADSISLLLSLCNIFDKSCLRVITLDHGIRTEAESASDADFVKKICLSLNVKFKLVKIPHGKIFSLSQENKKSVEEVARTIRYDSFYDFICEENLKALCLAHNKNDHLETILMRFLQGSFGEGLSGISWVRGKYIRPLLDITRDEIESYLNEKKQKWRNDSTNSDIKYYRNRIRNLLVPFLNENFTGWQKALNTGAQKAREDEDFIISEIDKIREKNNFSKPDLSFFSYPPAVKRRLLYSELNKMGYGNRFPFHIVEKISSWKAGESHSIHYDGLDFCLTPDGFKIIRDNGESCEEKIIESGFAFFVDKSNLTFVSDDFKVRSEENKLIFSSITGENVFSLDVDFPCLIRSAMPGDKILTSVKELKSLSDIFSNWKISVEKRMKIPVIEVFPKNKNNSVSIKALLGMFSGCKNWIVENDKLL